MNKTFKILLSSLCLLVSFVAAAHRDTSHNSILGAYYILPIEFPTVDNDAMNAQLQSMGLPFKETPKAAAGFGFQFHLDRTIINLNYNWQNLRTKSDTDELRIRYTGVSFNLGYDVLHNVRFSLYPYAGFKVCGVNYKLSQKIADSITTLQNYFSKALDRKEMYNSRIHLDLGIGFALRSFYLINLRGGYLVPLDKSEWLIPASKSTITNAPVTRYGPYITLTLGLGNIADERGMRRRHQIRQERSTEPGLM